LKTKAKYVVSTPIENTIIEENKWIKPLNLFGKILLFLVGIVLSLKAIKEPDLWWQLATGDWILANKSIPTTDVFSYSYFGTKWVNIKWGFEVLISLCTKAFGFEFIYVIQALVTIALLYFILKLVNLINKPFIDKTWANSLVLLCSFLFLAASSYRIIGRPEMFSHLFTVIFIYLLTLYKNKKPLIYLLPIIQLIWTNMHEAFGTGIVIIGIYVFAAWVEYFIDKNKEKPIHISLAFIFSIAVISINPYGFEMLTRPFEIFSQLSTNKYTTELSNYSTHEYWQTNTYFTLGFLIISFIGMLLIAFEKSNENKLKHIINQFGLANILLIIAFTILASSAYRNLIFLNIVLLPFTINSMLKIFDFIGKKVKFKTPFLLISFVTILVGIVFYISIVSNQFYKINKVSHTYGLQFSSLQNPAGAVQFLKTNNLENKTIFTDYLSSSYLLYKLNPNFKTLIDLRDLDVFPDSFFQKNAEAYANYESYKKLDEQYNFKAAVILNSQFKRLQIGLYNDSNYTLCYFDPLVSVFVKQQKKQNEIPLNIAAINNFKPSIFSTIINYVFNPFYKPMDVNETSLNTEAALFYLSLGNYKQANSLILNSPKNAAVNYIKGQYFFNMAIADSISQKYYNDSANTCLNMAVKENFNYFEAYFSLGSIELNQGNFVSAVKYFEKCCEIDYNNLNAHLYAGECYKGLVENNKAIKYLPKLVYHLEVSNEMNPNNPNIIWNLGVAYFKQGKCNLSTPILLKVKDYDGFSVEDKNTTNYCLNNCK
jgi:tetratricopeptide (TPR) repeat protein